VHDVQHRDAGCAERNVLRLHAALETWRTIGSKKNQ
jgi:hypothetical protein